MCPLAFWSYHGDGGLGVGGVGWRRRTSLGGGDLESPSCRFILFLCSAQWVILIDVFQSVLRPLYKRNCKTLRWRTLVATLCMSLLQESTWTVRPIHSHLLPCCAFSLRVNVERTCSCWCRNDVGQWGLDPMAFLDGDGGMWVSILCHQDTTDALPCHSHLPLRLQIMDPHSRAPKKNTSHGNEVLPQDATHHIQRPCYQRGSPCQDPAGNWTTWRSPDDRKETQTAVVWSCFPFIRSGQNHLARHSERGKKTRRTKEEVGRLHQGLDRPGVRQVPEGSGEQGNMEKTGCKIIFGAPTTLAVKGLMMMMSKPVQWTY